MLIMWQVQLLFCRGYLWTLNVFEHNFYKGTETAVYVIKTKTELCKTETCNHLVDAVQAILNVLNHLMSQSCLWSFLSGSAVTNKSTETTFSHFDYFCFCVRFRVLNQNIRVRLWPNSPRVSATHSVGVQCSWKTDCDPFLSFLKRN